MRQAGRHLPEYHKVRGTTNMLDACLTPELACELTLQPVRRYGVDAAVFYSDIMIPLKIAGLDITIQKGKGPVFPAPTSTTNDVNTIISHIDNDYSPITQAVRDACSELGSTPLLAFAGAPFTLASYIIEGGPSKDHLKARAFMKNDPHNWDRLMTWCAERSIDFLGAQIDAGASALQLFDSWAGSLNKDDYKRYVQPYSQKILQAFLHVPRIHFAVGASHLLEELAISATAVGIDWRMPLSTAAKKLPHTALQGNLDPASLFLPQDLLAKEVDNILHEGSHAYAHIFNLGHGMPPTASPDNVKFVVDRVHESKIR